MVEGREYKMRDMDFPTIDPANPYELTPEETEVMERLRQAFTRCDKLQKDVRFLFSKGGLYKVYNSNLLYHGCVPLDEEGNFLKVNVFGKEYSGKALYDIWIRMPEEVIMQAANPVIRQRVRISSGISGQARIPRYSAKIR